MDIYKNWHKSLVARHKVALTKGNRAYADRLAALCNQVDRTLGRSPTFPSSTQGEGANIDAILKDLAKNPDPPN